MKVNLAADTLPNNLIMIMRSTKPQTVSNPPRPSCPDHWTYHLLEQHRSPQMPFPFHPPQKPNFKFECNCNVTIFPSSSLHPYTSHTPHLWHHSIIYNHPSQHHPQLKTIYTCILKAPAINKSFVSLIYYVLNNPPPNLIMVHQLIYLPTGDF